MLFRTINDHPSGRKHTVLREFPISRIRKTFAAYAVDVQRNIWQSKAL
jgi:ribosomal protein S14